MGFDSEPHLTASGLLRTAPRVMDLSRLAFTTEIPHRTTHHRQPADNHAVHAKDGVGRFKVENTIALLGQRDRYPTEILTSRP